MWRTQARILIVAAPPEARPEHTHNKPPPNGSNGLASPAQALRKQSQTHRRRDGSGETSSLRLVHVRCRGSTTAPASVHASDLPTSLRGMFEPDTRPMVGSGTVP